MKILRFILTLLTLAVASFAVAIPLSNAFNADLKEVANAVLAVSTIVLVVAISLKAKFPKQANAFVAVALNQVIVAELMTQFDNLQDDFIQSIKSYDDKVNNNVINFNDIGADPNVLIDNTTYPIATAGRTDVSYPVSLKKLETENTTITDDELKDLPYDKKSSVMERHVTTLKTESIKLALHSLAPASNAAGTPIVVTTGADNGSGFKSLTIKDILTLKAIYDALGIPLDKRKLALCGSHVSDLCLLDNSFRDRYNSVDTGKIIKRLYGFDMFENMYNPVYNTSNVKKAFGAAAAGTDRNASTAFNNVHAMRAKGSVSMYMQKAEDSPLTRESIVGFRMYYIVNPVKNEGYGALVSVPV